MSADTPQSNLSQPIGAGLSIDLASGLDIDAQQVDHLLIMKSFADDLELAATVNRLAPTQMEVKPGTIVLGLVLDTHPLDKVLGLARSIISTTCKDEW